MVYGKSASRKGWEEIGTVSDKAGKDPVKIQALRGSRMSSYRMNVDATNLITSPATKPDLPQLKFDNQGNFKILQIADLHFSVGPGKCRDIANETACSTSPEASDEATLAWLGPLVDEAAPGLVVFSGDQLNGQESSWDAASVLYKVNSLMAERQIPWTVVYGNHDTEATDLDGKMQMRLMQTFPYFMGSTGPGEEALKDADL